MAILLSSYLRLKRRTRNEDTETASGGRRCRDCKRRQRSQLGRVDLH